MKQLLTISAIFISLNVFGQRDTLDYNLAVDYDTITYYTAGVKDTVVTYLKKINGDTIKGIYFVDKNALDSIVAKQNADIQATGALMEAYYREYKRQNTILWNLKKEYARWESINNSIYEP